MANPPTMESYGVS